MWHCAAPGVMYTSMGQSFYSLAPVASIPTPPDEVRFPLWRIALVAAIAFKLGNLAAALTNNL